MFISRIQSAAPAGFGFADPIVPGAPAQQRVSSRAQHARLLATAAARRLRSVERRRSHRDDDAGYWLACAPVAVAKAAGLRRHGDFRRLP